MICTVADSFRAVSVAGDLNLQCSLKVELGVIGLRQ